VSGERAARELGWRASTPFEDGVARYAAWHRAQPGPPEPLPEPAPRGRIAPAFRALGARAAPAALLSCVVLMLAGFLEVLHRAGSGGDDLRTIVITSLLGLSVYLVLIPPSRSREPRLAGLAWLSVGVLVLAILRWPHDVMRLAHSDMDLLVQSTVGSAFGVGSGMTGRRLLAGRLRERPSDTSG
jgi:hypothetical protein